jgi:hypothetical protein
MQVAARELATALSGNGRGTIKNGLVNACKHRQPHTNIIHHGDHTMNERTFQPTVTALLDPDWVEVIEELIDRDPTVSLAFAVEPKPMGQYVCEQGLPCDPYAWGYRTVADCEAFILAYRDTAALWAGMVQAVNDGQLALALADEFVGGNQHD